MPQTAPGPFDKSRIKSIPSNSTFIFDSTAPIVFIHAEPDCIVDQSSYLIENWRKFDIIYTWNPEIFEKCPNARLYHSCYTWLTDEYINSIDISKKKYKISTLCGSKQYARSNGHRMRIELFYKQDYFKIFPVVFFRSSVQFPVLPDLGNNPLLESGWNDKGPLFTEFQFSIVIENSKATNYFTEKLIDCLVSKTIPIYWGCPNIGDFFDTTGWILFDKLEEDLYIKLYDLDEDYYGKYIEVIEKNYQKAISLKDFYTNVENATVKT